jgi:hypothetical protein
MTPDACTELLAQAPLDAGLGYEGIADKRGRYLISSPDGTFVPSRTYRTSRIYRTDRTRRTW